MRISDWSSDVCSSDLFKRAAAVAGSADIGGDDIGVTCCEQCELRQSRAIGLWQLAGHFPQRAIAAAYDEQIDALRSEERRVGKECASTCRSRGSPFH